MNLSDYIAPRGAGKQLAAVTGFPQSSISSWACGTRPVPAHVCPEIEKATSGLVRCEDLRPDVDWGFLRNTPAVNPENSPNLEEAA
jgi:DNA-binding transcriptional regulator YdaS (Cro superfamily)